MPDFKLFTLAEAERTLPLVRRVVQDLAAEYPAWRTAVGRFEILTGGARADWGETQELIAARDIVTTHAERINRFLRELEARVVGRELQLPEAAAVLGAAPVVAGACAEFWRSAVARKTPTPHERRCRIMSPHLSASI